MIRGRLRRLAPRLAAALGGIAAASVLAPDVVLGHQLNATYTSRLPLAIYLAGAAIAVGLSFLFVLARVAKLSVERTTIAILPWLVPLLLSLALITYVPSISLWLPRQFF